MENGNREFDEAFDRFIESCDYEVSRNTLFSTVRQTFMAGWYAMYSSMGLENLPYGIFMQILPHGPATRNHGPFLASEWTVLRGRVDHFREISSKSNL